MGDALQRMPMRDLSLVMELVVQSSGILRAKGVVDCGWCARKHWSMLPGLSDVDTWIPCELRCATLSLWELQWLLGLRKSKRFFYV